MQRDFALMQRAAALSARVPFLAKLNLEESVRQFGAPLREQLDLCSEARNLARFNANFSRSKRVSFPKPIYPLVAPDVLVESFEEGDLISRYVDDPQNKHNEALADIGLESYLKMLLFDRFFHADLHPGNILVRVEDDGGPWNFGQYLKKRLNLTSAEHLVLLDVGMVAELTRDDQLKFVDFFKAITAKDGHALGLNILKFAEKETCERPDQFVADMKTLFDSLTWEQISDDTGGVIQDMMETVRQHQVTLRGVVSTVVVTTLVLEGWSSKLNPDIQMLAKLRSLLPATWPERINNAITAFGSKREVSGGSLIEV
jgi:aarF domain-containing kinase